MNFDNFDNSQNSFLWPEYFIDFLCERWIPCQASTSVLCLHYRPVTVHLRNNFPCIKSLIKRTIRPIYFNKKVLAPNLKLFDISNSSLNWNCQCLHHLVARIYGFCSVSIVIWFDILNCHFYSYNWPCISNTDQTIK